MNSNITVLLFTFYLCALIIFYHFILDKFSRKFFSASKLKPGQSWAFPGTRTIFFQDWQGNLSIKGEGFFGTTYRADGTTVYEYPDRRTSIHHGKGVIENIDQYHNSIKIYPDGRREGVLIDSNGLKQKYQLDGTVETIDKYHNLLKTYPDGRKEGVLINSQGLEQKHKLDGTVETIDAYYNTLIRRPDGSLEGKYRDPNGITHRYKDGNEYVLTSEYQWVIIDSKSSLDDIEKKNLGSKVINSVNNNQA